MSHDTYGPFQLSGSLATASLKEKLVAQQAANQDLPVVAVPGRVGKTVSSSAREVQIRNLE